MPRGRNNLTLVFYFFKEAVEDVSPCQTASAQANRGAALLSTSRWRSFQGLFLASSPPSSSSPPLSLLWVSCCPPIERRSCTNFIPVHKGRTHVSVDQHRPESGLLSCGRITSLQSGSCMCWRLCIRVHDCECVCVCVCVCD